MRLTSPPLRIVSLLVAVAAAAFSRPLGISATELRAATYSSIRSVTWYDFPSCFSTNPICLQNLQDALPSIKRNGFNTVWLVLPWSVFNPDPLASPPEYSEHAFVELARHLDVLRAHDMEAIIGLNYLGRGWSPAGIDACSWITDPVQYGAFEAYAREFLTRIDSYHDMVYILVFTENSVPCNLDLQRDAGQYASLLRPTLGSLPTRLPTDLRSRFRIGYHDYSVIDRGWGNGASPIQDPISFDFLSMALYGFEDVTTAGIVEEINARAARFAALYPATPLIAGELGASLCRTNEAGQARVLGAATMHLRDRAIGFNIWRWQPLPPYDSCVDGRLEITRPDGELRRAAVDLKWVLGPLIQSGIATPDPVSWTVTLTGQNFNAFYRARVRQSKGAGPWGSDLNVTLSADATRLSFVLPADDVPSNCSVGKTCPIQVQLVDRSNGLESVRFVLSLPKLADTVPPVVTLTSPSDGSSLVANSRVTISVDASDNVSVRKVEFSVNNSRVCTDTAAPYTCDWKVPKKAGVTYALTARASDTTGNAASTSITVHSP